MNIGIIGAGFAGLSAAHALLQEGCKVTVFEKDSHPGGLAVGYKKPRWDWSLEKHYHHFFTNDHSILSLAEDIHFDVLVRRPRTSVYVNGEIVQLDSPSSLLRFSHLSLVSRLRMAATLAVMRFNPFWRVFEPFSTSSVLPKAMGSAAYDLVWKPQMEGKFGRYSNDISLAWFWARVYKRTSSLAYPKEGFLSLAEKLTGEIESQGGDVLFSQEVQEIGSSGMPFVRTEREKYTFDKLIVTLPSVPFMKLAPSLSKQYIRRLSQLKGIGAVNVVLRLKKPFFTDKTYWLSVCDTSTPIMAIVEHTNFMNKEHYDNEHLVYVGKYAAPDDDIFKLSDKELLALYDPFLRKINKDYKKNIIGFDVFRAPFAQPIIPPNYSKIRPDFDTPLPNVYLANIQQVYPWDRGTNYAVELGEHVSQYILKT